MHIGELSGLTYVHLPYCCTDISSVGDSGILCCLTLTVLAWLSKSHISENGKESLKIM